MTRTILLITTLLVLALGAQADEQTLFSSNVSFGGFGGPGVFYTEFVGEPSVLIGGQGGVTLNKTVYIGCAGYGIGNQPDAGQVWHEGAWRSSRFEGGYGGAMLGAILYSDRVVHGTADVLIGAGGISKVINSREGDEWSDDHDNDYSTDGFFTVQPMAHVEVNTFRWMRINLGAGYRFVSGIEDFGLKNSDVSGPVAGVNLRFGAF